MCGFVIDPWNITPEKCGGVGYCYYGYNSIPYKQEVKEIPLRPVIYHNIIQEKPSIILKASYDYQQLNDIENNTMNLIKCGLEVCQMNLNTEYSTQYQHLGHYLRHVFNAF